jgi:hypothetical protein
MPNVGGKKFSYTPEGRKAAKAYSKRTGKAVSTNYRGGKTVAKKRKQGGGVTSVRGRGGPNVRPKVNVLGVGAARAHQAAQRGGLAGQQRVEADRDAARAGVRGVGMTAPRGQGDRLPHERGRPAPRIRPGYSKGGTVSYNDLIRSKGW